MGGAAPINSVATVFSALKLGERSKTGPSCPSIASVKISFFFFSCGEAWASSRAVEVKSVDAVTCNIMYLFCF